MKRVCHFGIFDPNYIRNAVIRLGFEAHGYEVVTLTVDPSIGAIKKFIALYRQYKALDTKTFDYVIVGYPGHTVVWLARLLFGKRVIFDAFLSLYDSNVFDRKNYGPWSIRGRRDWLYDFLACWFAYRVLLPEQVHIEYFLKTFPLRKEKYIQIYTGANDTVFRPLPDVQKEENFTVHFHGNFIPLQGIEYIIDAATELKNEGVHFNIVGSGSELYESTKKTVADRGLTNVHMVGRKPLEEVVGWINRAHVCLGVFGNTNKTKRVISNKIYECIAAGMPLITGKTPATDELFADRENVLFAEVANGADIAAKIRVLRDDKMLRERVAAGGRALFCEQLAPKKLVGKLILELQRS